MKEKIVCIEWEDAAYDSGYYNNQLIENFLPVRTRTVGHLIRKSRKEVLISTDRFYLPSGKIESDRHITTIPRKMVKTITYLRGK